MPLLPKEPDIGASRLLDRPRAPSSLKDALPSHPWPYTAESDVLAGMPPPSRLGSHRLGLIN